jgi:hypothetical protein
MIIKMGIETLKSKIGKITIMANHFKELCVKFKEMNNNYVKIFTSYKKKVKLVVETIKKGKILTN